MYSNILLDFALSNFWLCFLCCYTLALITWKIMLKQQKLFYTLGRVRQRFSVFDLQFAATPEELPRLIEGIDKLPDEAEAKNSKTALQRNLYVDFLFMFGLYPLIFLLCLKTSVKMDFLGRQIFLLLGYLQVLPFLCDVLENIYLLIKIKKPVVPSNFIHRLYQGTVLTKWTIASLGVVCSISALLYFWMTGRYETESLPFSLIIIVLFILIMLIPVRRAMNKRLKVS
jgi:hypothetical protein